MPHAPRTLRPRITPHTDDARSRRSQARRPAEELASDLEASEARYSAVVETAADAIVSADHSGAITHFNPAAERMFEMPSGEAVGKPLTILMPERFREAHRRGMERFLATGSAQLIGRTVEVAGRRKDGTEFPLEISLSTWKAADEVFFTGALRDMSERKAAERELRHLAAVVESSDDAIVTATPSGLVTSWNRGAELVLGYSAAEALGQHMSAVVPPDRVHEIAENLNRLSQGHPVDHHETKRMRKDGVVIDVSLSISPILDDEGAAVGIASIMRDITTRRGKEVELAAARAELERSNGDLLQFAYVASHELVEPVRVVAGYADLLQRRYVGRLDEDGVRFLDAVESGAERMQALIHDLLQFSRLGREGKPMARIDCDELVRGILADLEQRLAEADATASVGELPALTADAGQLSLVFRNLLVNALKFRSEDPPDICVSADRNGSGWRFSVRDNGIGIEPQDSERVFDMFQRLNGRDQFGGTGMGLALVKRVVERHGGQVSVEPAPGRGTVVSFTMPDAQLLAA
jgi:PAS domain S-box-containing protein